MNQNLYTPKEVAQKLKLARGTIYSAISRGELRSYKVGRSRRISEDQIREYVESKSVVVVVV